MLAEHESVERLATGHLSPGATPPPTQLTIFTPLSQPVLEKLREVDLNRLDAAGGAEFAGGVEEADRIALRSAAGPMAAEPVVFRAARG